MPLLKSTRICEQRTIVCSRVDSIIRIIISSSQISRTINGAAENVGTKRPIAAFFAVPVSTVEDVYFAAAGIGLPLERTKPVCKWEGYDLTSSSSSNSIIIKKPVCE